MHSNIIKSVATPSIHIILSLIYYKLLERNKHDVLYVVHDYRVSMYMHDSKLVSFPFNHKQMVRLERYSSKRLGRRARRVSKTYFFSHLPLHHGRAGIFWLVFIHHHFNKWPSRIYKKKLAIDDKKRFVRLISWKYRLGSMMMNPTTVLVRRL